MKKGTCKAILVATTIFMAQPAMAESFYSTASLTVLCGKNGEIESTICEAYVRGVVETWMLKDVTSANPAAYASAPHEPTFCEAIQRANVDEWVAVVRRKLSTAPSGFAADAVMISLAQGFCESDGRYR